ncbi:MAG: DUF2809 domain-containing protein [Cyanobacteria bacterium SBLK]|nr:DUF2809 domain-containing protein [Cyanobacteria bacterium SBLK]
MKKLRSNPRLLAFLSVVAIVPIGISTKFYNGIGVQWVNDYLGDVLYEMAWCWFFFIFFPTKKAIWKIPLSVFIVTCCLEFLQLWHPAWLQAIRATFAGRMLLGTTFVPADFFYYAIGCFLSWLWLQQIWSLCHTKPKH